MNTTRYRFVKVFSILLVFSFIIFAVALMFSPQSPAQDNTQSINNLSIVNLTLLNQSRVSRFEYDYIYQADIENAGQDVINVTATLKSTPSQVAVIDGETTFGDVPAGSIVTSSDTFTVRHDRRSSFDASALEWDIQATLVGVDGLPPDPGEEGKATLEGIDSDGDGVRDDIQRYIALTYPDSAKTRAALMVIAKKMQQALLDANDKSASLDHANDLMRASECLYYIQPDDGFDIQIDLEAEILNTEARSLAFIDFNDQLGGEIFPMRRIDQWELSCSFDPDALEN